MVSLRQKVFKYLRDHPLADNQELYEVFKDISESSLRQYKMQYISDFDSKLAGIDLDEVREGNSIQQSDNTKIFHY